ncbi:MAG: leucine-rich repeat protein [Candidatus Methanomethylophilaceae archaeon]|jgi:hypothetical protein
MGNIKASLFLAVVILVVFTAFAYVFTEVVPDDFDTEQGFSIYSDSPVPLGNQIEDIFDFKYTDTSAIVLKYKGQDEIVYVPNMIDDKPVTGIADGAFISNPTVKEVHLPDSVTELGISVFEKCSSLETVTLPCGINKISEKTFYECSSLNSLEIPDTVLTVDRLSFCRCSSLTHITIPYGVVELGQDAFSYSGLITIDLPETVSKIEKYAFYTCLDLKELTIPEGVTMIGAKTFWHCESMEHIYLPESLKTIEISAFVSCYSLKELHIPSNTTNISIYAFEYCNSLTEFTVGEGNSKYESIDGVLYDKTSKMLFACPALKEGHVTIAYGTKSINGLAFHNCINLTDVTIPDTVTKIGGSAFSSSSLTYIWIPSSVIDIVGSTFSGCHQLTEIEVSRDNPVYGSVDGILYRDNMETLFMAPPGKGGHITIPDGVKTIYGNAFYVNYVLTGVTFPDSLTAINSSAFWMCPALTDVIIPANVTEIGNYAFSECSSLEYIIFLGNGMEQSYGPIPVEKTIYYLEGNTGFESWRNRYKIPVSPPDKVTGVYFYNNSSELKFSWNYPANHIREITSYTISYREAGTDDPFRYLETYSNMGTSIAGLKSDTDYELRIVSENFAGTSESILSGKTLRIYSVDFKANGGNGVPPSAIYADEGTSLTLPGAEDLHMTGHSFIGWSLSPSGPSLENNMIVADDNVTLYAVWKTEMYTIYFETSGGDLIPPVQQYYGTSVDVPENPSREGHTFIDWDVAVPETMPAENSTICAIWEINGYNIVWIVDDVKLDIDIDYGSRINIPRFNVKEGHEFIGWDTEIPETMPAEDLTIKAIWSVNTYTLTRIVDGVQFIDYYSYGSEIDTMENPVKEGHTFIGWDKKIPKHMPAENLTITASWEINQYAVIFILGNGESNLVISRDYGTNIPIPENPNREGHTFLGWNMPIPSTMPSENLEISAEWSTNTYRIFWVIDGLETEQEYSFGTSISSVENPVKEGYTFAGWNPDVPETMPSGDIILQALWNLNTYRVSWNIGDTVFEVNAEYGSQIQVPKIIQREGCEFMGWDSQIPETMPAHNLEISALWHTFEYSVTWIVDDARIAETYEFGDRIILPEPPVKEGYSFIGWDGDVPGSMPSKDLEVTALWKINQYTVTLILNNGENNVSIARDYGAEIPIPEIPVKEGHAFEGWSAEIPEIMPAEDLTVSATWSVNKYSVRWIVDGIESVDEYAYGEDIQKNPPVKNGYCFDCWSGDVPAAMPSENLMFVAMWNIEKYMLTFDLGNSIMEISVDFGAEIDFDGTPERQGHEFIGWSSELPLAMPAENITVSALWNPKTYTVYWVVDGEVLESSEVQYGSLPSKPVDEPVKESDDIRHYSFIRWSPEPDIVAYDTVYHAVFNETSRTYIVAYDTNGGTGDTPPPASLNYGTVLQLSPIDGLYRDGHVLKGWSTMSSGNAMEKLEVKGNTTIYAVWDTVPNPESEDEPIPLVIPATVATSAVAFSMILIWRRMRQSGKVE